MIEEATMATEEAVVVATTEVIMDRETTTRIKVCE